MASDKKILVPLPTIEVTQDQATRLLSAFQNDTEYKKWLKNTLIDYVLSIEINKKRQSDEQVYTATATSGRTELGYIE